MTPSDNKRLVSDTDGIRRCWWCTTDADYIRYHDTEWGRPIADDRRLFEKVCLEGFQAGLSWLTILRKRDRFRQVFAEFDFEKIARFNRRSVERLMNDAGIVRNRAKIESTVNNARRAIEMRQTHGSLAAFFWQFEPQATVPFDATRSESSESRALSKALKSLGWTFVGPTTMYALMQAMGMVNDHVQGCFVRAEIDEQRAAFDRPTSG